MKLEEVIRRLEELKPLLWENFKVVRIGIFGSVVRGETREDSDIDILVKFSEPIGLQLFDLKEFFERVIERKVHLVSEEALSPYIKPYIEKEIVYI